MPYYGQDATGKLVPIRGEDIPQEAIMAIERADESAIIEHLVSPFGMDNFLYSYTIDTKDGKKDIIGIGVDGAAEIACLMGNVEVLTDVKVEEKDDYFYGMVRARDLLRNVTLLGVARQCKYMLDKGNRPIKDRPNEHAFTCAITKGQRNAILAVCSNEVIVRAVDKFAEQKKIKRLPPAPHTGIPPVQVGSPASQRPPVATIPTPNYSSVIGVAKELGYTQQEMCNILDVDRMSVNEWKAKGITPEIAIAKIRKHKDELRQKVEAQVKQLEQAGQQVWREVAPSKDEEGTQSPEAGIEEVIGHAHGVGGPTEETVDESISF